MTPRMNQKERLVKAWQNDRLAHAYLFYGNRGNGMSDLALFLAQTIFCQTPISDGACGECLHCKRIVARDFPDMEIIDAHGAQIKVDTIRELISSVQYSSLETGKKVFIVYDVDKLSNSAANSLLKFLEEPSSTVYFLLLTNRKDQVLQTIQSRCQLVYLPSPNGNNIEQILQEEGVSVQLRRVLASLTKDVTTAKKWAVDETFLELVTAIEKWMQLLLRRDAMAFVTVETTLKSLITNKQWAKIGVEYIVILAHRTLQNDATLSQTAMIIIKHSKTALNYLESNVSANAVYEWLCVVVLGGRNGQSSII